MTYETIGSFGTPQIASFLNGKPTGRMATSIVLPKLDLQGGSIGPFSGIYDELRFYDYALTPQEVHSNHQAGPDTIRLLAPDE